MQDTPQDPFARRRVGMQAHAKSDGRQPSMRSRHFATFGLAPAAAFFIPNPARHPFQGWRLGDQVRTLDALGRWMEPSKGVQHRWADEPRAGSQPSTIENAPWTRPMADASTRTKPPDPKTRLTKEDRGQDHPPPDPRCRRAPGHQGRRANPPSGIDEPDATQSGVSDGGRQCQPDPPRWPSHNTGVTKAMPTQNRRRHVSGSTPIRDETAEASAAPRWAFRNRLAAKNGEPKEDYEGHQEGKECHRLREGKALKRWRTQRVAESVGLPTECMREPNTIPTPAPTPARAKDGGKTVARRGRGRPRQGPGDKTPM